MNFIINKLASIIPARSLSFTSNQGNFRIAQKEEGDVFIKSPEPATKPESQSTGSTTQGSDLKTLDNITCPYSGVKMLSYKKMEKVENKLKECTTLEEQINILRPYRNCMQKTEKQIYEMMFKYAQKNPGATVNDCLNYYRPDCLARLKIEEFQVLDKIDKSSDKLDANTALKVRKMTTRARKILLDDRHGHVFKRKDLLERLYTVADGKNDKHIAEMWETANKLPRSTNNINAFVVKYANRDATEICSRLLRPSVASIEHITPASKKGNDTICNFMLVARDWNSDRSNIPLPEYIKKHPNIPKYSQRHTDDIIKAIKFGKLKNYDWYPYVLKEKLYNESEGIINVSLAAYHRTSEEAMSGAPEEVINIYNDLVDKNKKIRQQRSGSDMATVGQNKE